MEFDVMGIMIKSATDDIIYGFGNDEDQFRKKAIRIKNLVNDLIEEIYNERYVDIAIQKDYPASSPNNIRYCRCVCCGEIKPISEFVMYGGRKTINEGVCRDCDNILEEESDEIETIQEMDSSYADYHLGNDGILYNH